MLLLPVFLLIGGYAAYLWIARPAPADVPTASAAPVHPASLTVDEDGRKVYMTRCMSCHQMNGQGINGVFPPLIDNEWVEGDKGRLIRILLHGMTGETEVNGVTYSGAMPPWGTFLNDAQIAAVLTYIRSSWGNEAEAVTPAEVAQVRAATQDRKGPWKDDELHQEENLGIPGTASKSE